MNSISNNLDSIIKEKSRECQRRIREFLIKRGIKVPSHIKIIIIDNFYFLNNSKPVISYNENNNTIFLDGFRIKKDILGIINIYDKKHKEDNSQLSHIFVPLEYQLFSRNPTIQENYIMIPTKSPQQQNKKASPYDYIVENYMKFALLHGIWLSVEGIRNLKLPEKIKEYIIYTLVILSYYSTFHKNLGLPNKVIYISLYNTMGCTKILKSAASLINKDPFTVGTCTGYNLLDKHSSDEINLKDAYEELIKNPFYFLKEYF
jgi:hypothetical protein